MAVTSVVHSCLVYYREDTDVIRLAHSRAVVTVLIVKPRNAQRTYHNIHGLRIHSARPWGTSVGNTNGIAALWVRVVCSQTHWISQPQERLLPSLPTSIVYHTPHAQVGCRRLHEISHSLGYGGKKVFSVQGQNGLWNLPST